MMNNVDTEYLATLEQILKKGNEKTDRTGTGTKSLFGLQMRFDLSKGFPLLTTKQVHFKSVMVELLFFLRGEATLDFLQENQVTIWNEWSVPLDVVMKAQGFDGYHEVNKNRKTIGAMYGLQWRRWKEYLYSHQLDEFRQYSIDQISNLVSSLKNNPNSRRHLVSAWNVADLPDESVSPQQNVINGKMALAPCHYAFQCYVNDGKLSMLINQRSADMFLGVPFNIASYALLTHLLAQVCGYEVGELIWNGGDCHIYNNHIEQCQEQLQRAKEGKIHPLPTLWLNPDIDDIDQFTIDDIKIQNYQHEPKIKAEVAV